MSLDEMACKELVEVVTDYLEGALPQRDRARLDAHLEECPGCVTHLDQMRETIKLLGSLTPEVLSGEEVEPLLEVFRRWKKEDD